MTPPAVSPRPTTRADRWRDAAAVACVVAGAAIATVAHMGLRHLASGAITVRRGEFAVNQFDRYQHVQLAGYALALVGIVIGVVSYVLYARRARRARGGGGPPPDVTGRP